MKPFYVAAIPGTERALCEELRELGFASVRLNRGGIPFRGEWRDGWRACLQSRIAQRIQFLVHRFPAPSNDALYDGVRSIDWSPYITHAQTISVGAVVQASHITHSGFAALKVKDAIVDSVRTPRGRRPSVSKDSPDVRVFLYLANDKAALYLDMSGEPLSRRGYRSLAGEAPLRETLAAAMLRMAGWDCETPLMDPMCGSGTIPIEAAMWAADVAPGISRKQFGFERWARFSDEDRDELRAMRGSLRSNSSARRVRIVGTDIDSTVLEIARANARMAGVRLSFRQASVADLRPSGSSGFAIMNPPYGVRLEKDRDLVRQVATSVMRLHGWRVVLLAGSKDYEKAISAKPARTYRLPNGNINCDLLIYDIT